MLSRFTTEQLSSECVPLRNAQPVPESRYTRDEEEDLKKAIGYLYEFKKKLDSLHPNCVYIIEHMLQNNNRSC